MPSWWRVPSSYSNRSQNGRRSSEFTTSQKRSWLLSLLSTAGVEAPPTVFRNEIPRGRSGVGPESLGQFGEGGLVDCDLYIHNTVADSHDCRSNESYAMERLNFVKSSLLCEQACFLGDQRTQQPSQAQSSNNNGSRGAEGASGVVPDPQSSDQHALSQELE
jgi:hypothetical protein